MNERVLTRTAFAHSVAASSGSGITTATEEMWWHLYTWVVERGYADTADQPGFVEHVQAFRGIEVGGINRHLRRMAGAGLLEPHRLTRKLDARTKDALKMGTGIFDVLSGQGSASTLPSVVVRYTLPGASPPLKLSRARLAIDAAERGWERQRQVHGTARARQHLLIVHEPEAKVRLVWPGEDVASEIRKLSAESPRSIVYVIEAPDLPPKDMTRVVHASDYLRAVPVNPSDSE